MEKLIKDIIKTWKSLFSIEIQIPETELKNFTFLCENELIVFHKKFIKQKENTKEYNNQKAIEIRAKN